MTESVYLTYDKELDNYDEVADRYYKLYPHKVGKVTLFLLPKPGRLRIKPKPIDTQLKLFEVMK